MTTPCVNIHQACCALPGRSADQPLAKSRVSTDQTAFKISPVLLLRSFYRVMKTTGMPDACSLRRPAGHSTCGTVAMHLQTEAELASKRQLAWHSGSFLRPYVFCCVRRAEKAQYLRLRWHFNLLSSPHRRPSWPGPRGVFAGIVAQLNKATSIKRSPYYGPN